MFLLGAFTAAFIWLVWEILRYKEALRIEEIASKRVEAILDMNKKHQPLK